MLVHVLIPKNIQCGFDIRELGFADGAWIRNNRGWGTVFLDPANRRRCGCGFGRDSLVTRSRRGWLFTGAVIAVATTGSLSRDLSGSEESTGNGGWDKVENGARGTALDEALLRGGGNRAAGTEGVVGEYGCADVLQERGEDV